MFIKENRPLCFSKETYISVIAIVDVGQTPRQLSQNTHSPVWYGSDLESTILKTPCGQTFTHSSQPSHFSVLTETIYIAATPPGFS